MPRRLAPVYLPPAPLREYAAVTNSAWRKVMPDQEQSRRDIEDAIRKLREGAGNLGKGLRGQPVPKVPKGNKVIVKPDGTVEIVPQ